MQRYQGMPEDARAELIFGRVFMAAAAVRIDQHGRPDALIQGWLFNYTLATPRVELATNTTSCLADDKIPQPDCLLRIDERCGGGSRVNDDGYLEGPPELVAEVAASSASIDVHEKKELYRQAGVKEYIVWRTRDAALDWWRLDESGAYVDLTESEQGVVRSTVFPGLWLNRPALLYQKAREVIATLNEGLATSEHAAFVGRLAAE